MNRRAASPSKHAVRGHGWVVAAVLWGGIGCGGRDPAAAGDAGDGPLDATLADAIAGDGAVDGGPDAGMSMAIDAAMTDDDAGPSPDAGMDAAAPADAGLDASSPPDAGLDASSTPDAGLDASSPMDATLDASSTPDAGLDASSPMDATAPTDAGTDASSPMDASTDATLPTDAGPDGGSSACTPSANLRVTNDGAYSDDPSLVWNGSGYGVAWNDGRDGNAEIYFARLDAAGAKIGSDVRVTNAAGTSESAEMVWNGSEYGIVWYDDRDGNYEVYFTRLDATGAEIGDDVRVTNDPATQWGAVMAWSGSEYGLAWWDTRDGNDELYFARLSATGAKIGSDVRVTVGGDVQTPAIASNGTGYALAWGDRRTGSSEVYFARLDSAGARIGTDLLLTGGMPGIAGLTSIVWSGTEYGVGWEDTPAGTQQLYFARVSATGTLVGSAIGLGPMGFSPWNIAWTGSGYGLGYSSSRDGNPEVYLTRLDAAGASAAADERVTNDPNTSRAPSLVWTGSGYAVAWGDPRPGNYEIYFARLCP